MIRGNPTKMIKSKLRTTKEGYNLEFDNQFFFNDNIPKIRTINDEQTNQHTRMTKYIRNDTDGDGEQTIAHNGHEQK